MTSTTPQAPVRRARRTAVGLVLVVVLAAPAGAFAGGGEDSPLDDVSSVDQYVEDIPTASGGTPTGGGPGEGDDPGRPLSPDVAGALDSKGGADADALGRLATSPALGAPRARLRAGPAVQRALAENASVAGAVGSAASGTTPALYALVVLLVGLTAGLLGVAVGRARR